jgi:hypothetical protein
VVRTVGRTAVVAGTATAVAGGVSRRRSRKYAEKENAAIADQQAAYNQGAADAAPAPPPPPAPGGDDTIAKLKQLGELHASGVLTDAEFEAQKAKVLAG